MLREILADSDRLLGGLDLALTPGHDLLEAESLVFSEVLALQVSNALEDVLHKEGP